MRRSVWRFGFRRAKRALLLHSRRRRRWDSRWLVAAALVLSFIVPRAALAGEPGAEGDLYVVSVGNVRQYDGVSGAFVADFVPYGSGGLEHPRGLAFGPSGNLFVVSQGPYLSSSVLEFDGSTGAFVGEFVPSGTEGMCHAFGLAFGPNGNLFVANIDSEADVFNISEYDGTTGAFQGVLISGSTTFPGGVRPYSGFIFGPNGNVFLANNHAHPDPLVLEYDGETGDLVGEFVGPCPSRAAGLTFAPSGNLLQSNEGTEVLEYDASSREPLGVFAGEGLDESVGISFGPRGDTLFVVSCRDNKIQEYDGVTGQFLRTFVSSGFSCSLPQGFFLTFKPSSGPFPAPQVTGMSPSEGDGCGMENKLPVTVSGTGLLPHFAAVRLTMAGQTDIAGHVVGGSAPTSVIVEFDLTGATAGTWDLVVSYPDGGPSETLTDAFQIALCPPPTVTGVSPQQSNNCPPTPGHPLRMEAVVTGTGFVPGLTVTLAKAGEDDIIATGNIVESSTTLVAQFQLWDAAAGMWDVVVTNYDGQTGTLATGLEVTSCPPPQVTAFQPQQEDHSDFLVGATISGSDFVRGTQLVLTMAGQADIRGTNVSFESSGELTAEFDLRKVAPGLWSLVATNPDGQIASLPDCLEVIAGPCVARKLGVRITELYSEFEPLPGLPGGERPVNGLLDRSGNVFFGVTESVGGGRDHLFCRRHLGPIQRLYFGGQVVDGVPTADRASTWWVSEDGYVSIREQQSLLLVPAGTTTIQTIVRTGMPLPDLLDLPGVWYNGGASMSYWQAVGIGGQVFFDALLAGEGVNCSNRGTIFAAFAGQMTLHLRQGDLVGPGTLGRFDNSGNHGPRAVNALGWQLIRFETEPFDAEPPEWHQVLATGPANDFQAFAWTGGPAPGVPGGVYYQLRDGTFASIQLNDAGEVAYCGHLTDGRAGLWAGPREGPQLVAINGAVAPGTEGETFLLTESMTWWASYSLNDLGQVALRARLSPSGDFAVWLGTGPDDLTLVVRGGDTSFAGPAGEEFQPHRELVLNDRGDLAIRGTLATGGSAVWLREHRAGQWIRLAGTGDTLAGRLVNDVWISIAAGAGADLYCNVWQVGPGSARAIAPDGTVVLAVNEHFNYGYEAIYLAELVPSGDFDGDGDVDLDDFATFTECLAGPGALPEPNPPATQSDCLSAFDAEPDNDIDSADFATFMQNFTGAP